MEREDLEKVIEKLMEKAKGNKNSIDMGEVQEAVKDLDLTEEQMESFLLLLENKGYGRSGSDVFKRDWYRTASYC